MGKPAKTAKASKPATLRAAPRPRKPGAKPGAKRAAKPTQAATPYHHGALRDALLAAAETLLQRDGLAGLTLRAVAREAGVSHAAPTHHFGDLAGLVSDLAAIGFQRFNAAMAAAGAGDGAPLEKALRRALAYLAYARAHPAMYLLMFRTERLDMRRPALREAAEAAFAGLTGAIGIAPQHRSGDPAAPQALSLEQAAEVVRAWSLVHGYTTLLLDGRLAELMSLLPEGSDPETLFVAMLKSTVRPPL
ncbi:WHG domain-containing protein [Rhodopseudomonas palustris]|uniref:Putative transcriptional regulator, TetR family n=1 Tax=Rhodopseudomonas palustris (strain BisB18) TaxID=316056 RepID=Q218T7_RHOPB